MSDPTVSIKRGLFPYSDGSGFPLTIEVTKVDGEVKIRLRGLGSDIIDFEASQWREVHDEVVRCIIFCEAEE